MAGRNDGEEDTIKIMLATDNHIGYLERDPVRSHDASNTFEEILQLAVKHQVDFILLAGDLFHDNKPTRESIYRTTALLRKYCLGDKPISIELLSDPMESKSPGFEFPAVNYEDPNYNIAIPVFSIHGNHDDPQGAGQDGALCALDLLSVSGLINYFGKTDLPTNDYASKPSDPSSAAPNAPNTEIDGINIKPVLLQKGSTKLGLYGIGNVRDTRMHFELMHNRVKMWKPRNAGEYCNLLLVHQNRVKHGPNDSVPEGMFDDSINLVIWGHEHDQRIMPEDVAGKNYKITQPGSSVATSLTEGESIQKHVALLRITGSEYELEPIPLKTVRPFMVDDLDLATEADEEGVDLTDTQAVMKFIRGKIEQLIVRVKEKWVERMQEALEDETIEYPDNVLPLIRLRVDTTGVPNMGNPNRIGQEFQGRIANSDPVSYTRAKKSAARKVKIDQPELSIDDPSLSISDKLSRVRVGTLVKEFLAAQELELLGENAMSDAVRMFVEKDEGGSIASYVKSATRHLVKDMEAREAANEADVQDALHELKDQNEKAYEEEQEKRRADKAAKKKSKQPEDDARSVDSMDVDDFPDGTGGGGGGSDDYDLESDPPPKKKKAAASSKAGTSKAKAKTTKASTSTAKSKAKAPAKGKGKKLFNDSDDELDDDPEADMDLDSDEDLPPPPKKKSKADILSAPAKKAPAKKAAARPPVRTAAKKKPTVIDLSD